MNNQPDIKTIRSWNAIVEAIDQLTLGCFDRVTSVPALLYYTGRDLGTDSPYYKTLVDLARKMNYNV